MIGTFFFSTRRNGFSYCRWVGASGHRTVAKSSKSASKQKSCRAIYVNMPIKSRRFDTSRDVIGMMFFRLRVMGFSIECVLAFAISGTARPVCKHDALYTGQNTRKCVKSTKACSNPDLTHLASHDVIQTYAIRLPDGGFLLILSSVWRYLASFPLFTCKNSYAWAN
jgi:hypothetical protein